MNADGLLQHYERIADAPDAIDRLRQFILELAVRGKLATQDANDGAVAISLQRRKISCSAEGPFELPESWIWVSVGAVAETRLGKMLDKAKNKGTPRRYLRNVNVRWFDFDLSDMLEMKFEDAELSEFALKCGDVLVCEGGEPGRAAVWDERATNVYFQKALHRIRFLPLVDAAYFVKGLRASADDGRLAESFTGTGIKHFTGKALDAYLFPLPPIAEQHRIVAKVDELMALCDRLEAARTKREATRDRLAAASLARLNAPDPETFHEDARFALDALPALTARPDQIKQLRQTILNLAVRGKLVPQDPKDEPPPVGQSTKSLATNQYLDIPLPANWRWVQVADVASSRLGKMLDKTKNKGRDYPYLRNTNVHWFEVRLDDLKSIPMEDRDLAEYSLENGDVLICEGGHGIGRTAVWRSERTPMVFQKALHRVRPHSHLDSDFFAYCCFVYYTGGVMQTYFTGVGIPHFTGRALSQLRFPLPPIAEQRRIVERVYELMVLCDGLEASIVSGVDARHRLLEALLHEALVPREALEEAA